VGLDIVEVVMAIEEAFAVELPHEELALVGTAGDLLTVLLRKLDVQPGDERAAAVWERLRGIVSAELGVRLDRVTPSAHFARDLGAD
jgi:acyl carrier protein